MQIFALEMKPVVHTHQQPDSGEISTTSMSTSTPAGMEDRVDLAITPFRPFFMKLAMDLD